MSRQVEQGQYRDQACAGRPGRGADFAALGGRCFLRLLQRRGLSGALLFWDLVAAYHKVIRQLVFGCSLYSSDEEVAFLVKRLDLPPETMPQLAAFLKAGHGLIAEAGVSDHLSKIVEEAHATTFFVVSGAEAPYETHLGGMPGGPFADMVHHFLCLNHGNDYAAV